MEKGSPGNQERKKKEKILGISTPGRYHGRWRRLLLFTVRYLPCCGGWPYRSFGIYNSSYAFKQLNQKPIDFAGSNRHRFQRFSYNQGPYSYPKKPVVPGKKGK